MPVQGNCFLDVRTLLLISGIPNLLLGRTSFSGMFKVVLSEPPFRDQPYVLWLRNCLPKCTHCFSHGRVLVLGFLASSCCSFVCSFVRLFVCYACYVCFYSFCSFVYVVCCLCFCLCFGLLATSWLALVVCLSFVGSRPSLL